MSGKHDKEAFLAKSSCGMCANTRIIKTAYLDVSEIDKIFSYNRPQIRQGATEPSAKRQKQRRGGGNLRDFGDIVLGCKYK